MALAHYAIATFVLALSLFFLLFRQSTGLSMPLAEFLGAEDLDDLLRAATELRELKGWPRRSFRLVRQPLATIVEA